MFTLFSKEIRKIYDTQKISQQVLSIGASNGKVMKTNCKSMKRSKCKHRTSTFKLLQMKK